MKAFEKLSDTIKEKNAQADSPLMCRETQKNAAQETIHLKLLYEQAKNENHSKKLRIKAVEELKPSYPKLLKLIHLENIGSKKAAQAIHRKTEAIMSRAKAGVDEEKIDGKVPQGKTILIKTEKYGHLRSASLHREKHNVKERQRSEYHSSRDIGKKISPSTSSLSKEHKKAKI